MKKFLWKLKNWIVNTFDNTKPPVVVPKPNESIEQDPPWLKFMKEQLGQKEYLIGSNPFIAACFALCGFDPKKHDDSALMWCSMAIHYVMDKAKMKRPKKSKARAKAWANYYEDGITTKLSEPKHGCILVFNRGKGKDDGHIGLYDKYAKHTKEAFHVLGGNQSDSVCYSYYKKSNLVGYYWPKPNA